ncbi:unnamed protein product [Adineta steineri]|uniref:Uncharacterized protein n=1 Tax=Adineta steineri TaxID=433720 RepID=A0A815EQ92_9BILA|nr:unnamed protein product [Adineta steineri]CAF1315192.1 unnamed protein product [Adineta steineri]
MTGSQLRQKEDNSENTGDNENLQASIERVETNTTTSVGPDLGKTVRPQSEPNSPQGAPVRPLESRPATTEKSTNNFRRTVLICLAVFVSAISAILISIYLKSSTSTVCDMKKAENRDFNKYYGIANMKNHFITPSADNCAASIIFKPALPQAILQQDHSASSFLTLAPYGTGKTLLRCEYYKSLRSDAYFKVLILNKEIDGYLDRTALRKLHTLRQDEDKLVLLLAVTEDKNFTIKALETTRSINVLNDLRHFALFMKNHVKKTVVFIIDGIDENRFFFKDLNVNKQSLELFCLSSLSQEIIAMAMADNFYLSIFYPKIDGIEMERGIIRKDKFPTLVINWNIKSLMNYADYVLQEMNKNVSASHCKLFTNFKTLVNYSNTKNAETINKITTPRALHYFMRDLIPEMNHCANDVQEPFIATTENVETAYESSAKSAFKVHYIKE